MELAMSDDRFLEHLREHAASLRFDADPQMSARIAARVRGRISAQPGVAQFLARWIRPLAASLTALALAASVSVVWIDPRSDNPSVESMSAGNSVEISVDGDSFSVGE
jgi:hypothetical protein